MTAEIEIREPIYKAQEENQATPMKPIDRQAREQERGQDSESRERELQLLASTLLSYCTCVLTVLILSTGCNHERDHVTYVQGRPPRSHVPRYFFFWKKVSRCFGDHDHARSFLEV